MRAIIETVFDIFYLVTVLTPFPLCASCCA